MATWFCRSCGNSYDISVKICPVCNNQGKNKSALKNYESNNAGQNGRKAKNRGRDQDSAGKESNNGLVIGLVLLFTVLGISGIAAFVFRDKIAAIVESILTDPPEQKQAYPDSGPAAGAAKKETKTETTTVQPGGTKNGGTVTPAQMTSQSGSPAELPAVSPVQQPAALPAEPPVQQSAALPAEPYDYSVTQIDCSKQGKTDLLFLLKYPNLQDLTAGKNNISDLTPLASLPRLTKITMQHTLVRDLSPLRGMTQLKVLQIGETAISDLSPLAGLYNLEEIDVWYTDVADLSPLSGLRNLKRLYLSHSRVTSLDPLVNLPNLELLSLSDLQITDGSLDRFRNTHPNCKIYSYTHEEEMGWGTQGEYYIMPTSDILPLAEDFVRRYSTDLMWYAKNEIYARHGRKFKDQQLQNYFSSMMWYEGTIEPEAFNDNTMLSDVERKNVDLLSRLSGR